MSPPGSIFAPAGPAGGSARRLGVLGWPVAHSRSPAIHNAALAALGMDGWRYQLLPVPPELLAETTSRAGSGGLRRRQCDDPAQARGALRWRARRARRRLRSARRTRSRSLADGAIAAENTDAPGLIAALGLKLRGMSALVLGAGGSARAAVWALREGGAREVSMWNRTSRARRAARAGARCAARPRSRLRGPARQLHVGGADPVPGSDLRVGRATAAAGGCRSG